MQQLGNDLRSGHFQLPLKYAISNHLFNQCPRLFLNAIQTPSDALGGHSVSGSCRQLYKTRNVSRVKVKALFKKVHISPTNSIYTKGLVEEYEQWRNHICGIRKAPPSPPRWYNRNKTPSPPPKGIQKYRLQESEAEWSRVGCYLQGVGKSCRKSEGWSW